MIRLTNWSIKENQKVIKISKLIDKKLIKCNGHKNRRILIIIITLQLKNPKKLRTTIEEHTNQAQSLLIWVSLHKITSLSITYHQSIHQPLNTTSQHKKVNLLTNKIISLKNQSRWKDKKARNILTKKRKLKHLRQKNLANKSTLQWWKTLLYKEVLLFCKKICSRLKANKEMQ